MASSWWTSDHHRDRRPGLVLRANLASNVRSWFGRHGFIEAEPGCLQISPGNETHLHGFATDLVDAHEQRHRLYLHTSPEFALKKLLAAGEQKIFSFSPVFRNRESGPLHLPEFKMLEWYRAGEPVEHIIQDCISVLGLAHTLRGGTPTEFRGRHCELGKIPDRISVAEAFRTFANIDILAALSDDPRSGNRDQLAAAATSAGHAVSDDDTWSDIFSKVLTSAIEPKLGLEQPAILYDYPLPEAALARQSSNDPRLGERFEVYCCGVELANGFAELTDADEQRRRFETAMAEQHRIYGESYPIDAQFLKALQTMPEASGVALGFDRLVMLMVGAERLDHVVWTPPEFGDAGP